MDKNMIVRAGSGLVYVALILGGIFCGGIPFSLLILLFTILALTEFRHLVSGAANISRGAFTVDLLLIAVVFASQYARQYYGLWNKWVWILSLLPIFYVMVRLTVAVLDKSENPVRSFAYSMFSMLYIFLPLQMLIVADTLSSGNRAVLAVFICIWINDTGAYLCGRAFGRHKLCERLSPKKTWEGFWGGCALSVVAAMIFGIFLSDSFTGILGWIVFGALVSVFGTFGDLFESMLKRRVGVKDSGTLIPGHGGILDRIDSLLAVAPLALVATLLLF